MASTIKDLFINKTIKLALLPERNDYLLRDELQNKLAQGTLTKNDLVGDVSDLDLAKIDRLDGIVLTLIKKDYPGLSPKMWNSLYDEIELKHGKKYQHIFAVAEPNENTMHVFLKTLLQDSRCIGGGAGSGFKDVIAPYIKEYGTLTPRANIIGAINVIYKDVKNGKNTLIGDNTDGEGFVQGLISMLNSSNETITAKKIVILGAGGTCAAIACTLLDYDPEEVVIVNRTVSKAEELALRINKQYNSSAVRAVSEDMIAHEIKNANAIVNASDKGGQGPLQMYSAFGPITTDSTKHADPNYFVSDLVLALKNMSYLPKDAVIADVNLTKTMPMTLQYAKASGYTKLQDGLEMVARQAVPQVAIRHPGLVDVKIAEKIFFYQAGLHG